MILKRAIVFSVLTALLVVLKSNILTAPFHWDVMGYVIPAAENIYSSGVIICVEESTGHPPLFFMTLALTWKIFGKSLLVSHLFNLVLGGLGLTLLFLLAEKLYGVALP